jgi:hypothetical protein
MEKMQKLDAVKALKKFKCPHPDNCTTAHENRAIGLLVELSST